MAVILKGDIIPFLATVLFPAPLKLSLSFYRVKSQKSFSSLDMDKQKGKRTFSS